MSTKYRISEDDYVKAGDLFGKLTKRQSFYCALITFILLVAVIFSRPPIQGALIAGLITAFVLTLILKYLVNPAFSRRHYQKYKAIHDEFEIDLLDDGIYIASPSGSGKVIWDSVFKWRQNDSYVLVYPMPRLYYIVPKLLATNGFDIDLLVKKLTENVGNAT